MSADKRKTYLARIVGGMILALPLIRCARDGEQRPKSPPNQPDELQAQLDACRKAHDRLISGTDLEALRAELQTYAAHVRQEERRRLAMQRAMDDFTRSVGLIYGKFTVNEIGTDGSTPVTDAEGNKVEFEYLGSGFMASQDGDILTNRHLVEPWWNNEAVAPLLQRGLEPQLLSLSITFPSHEPQSIDLATIRVSQDGVDLATFRAAVADVPALPLSDRDPIELRGQGLMLMGYPTGLSALLGRAEPEVASAALADAEDLTALIGALSKRQAITPVITHGMLNDVTAHKLIYDAVTTSGGSGGPVFGVDGEVIGVNFAVLREFQGSNYGVPIRFARFLVPKEG